MASRTTTYHTTQDQLASDLAYAREQLEAQKARAMQALQALCDQLGPEQFEAWVEANLTDHDKASDVIAKAGRALAEAQEAEAGLASALRLGCRGLLPVREVKQAIDYALGVGL